MTDGTYPRAPRAFVSRTNEAAAYESNDSQRPGSNPRASSIDGRPAGDPLLELARLIGQRDSHAAGRGREDTERSLGSPYDERSNRHWEYQDQREYSDNGSASYARQDSYQDAPASPARSGMARSEQLLEQMREQVRQERERQQRERLEREGLARQQQDYAAETATASPALGDPSFTTTGYQAHPGSATAMDCSDQRNVRTADYAEDDGYADGSQHDGYETGEYAEEDADNYDSEGNSQENGARYEERTLPFRRRHATALAVAVFGLAVVGTAGAFGYYTVFKGGVQGPAPVIKADNAPTKMLPAGTSGEGSSKPINERLGDASQERVVRREEDPVVLRDAPRPTNNSIPAIVAPSPIGAPDIAAPVAPGSSAEPKKVRTVTIRADQGISAPAPASAPERATPSGRAPSIARSSAQQVASTQQASPALAAQPGGAGAPLALTPQAVGSTQAPADTGARIRPPRPEGGFVVQLSAQKNEAEAQASFNAMQQRYSALSGRQPLIRRKDQGDRGVFYAAQVGPFGSREEAVQLCESLKSVGGNCFVQRN